MEQRSPSRTISRGRSLVPDGLLCPLLPVRVHSGSHSTRNAQLVLARVHLCIYDDTCLCRRTADVPAGSCLDRLLDLTASFLLCYQLRWGVARMIPPMLIASLNPPLIGATWAVNLEVQSLLVDLLIAGSAIYVSWSLWRSWRGNAGCARCHSCSPSPESLQPSDSSPPSTRFSLPQL